MKKLIAVLIALNALAWALVVPRLSATGTLSIPNTISAQPAGNLAASLLDANWSAISSYVNAREITIDVFANRPAAGVKGRRYLATDINLGTLYEDDGSAWRQAAAGVTATTTYTNELASLTLINSSATNMNIAPGATASDDGTFTNRVLMTVATDLIKLVDTAWAVGTNQGCLDTGSITNGTIHFFVIQRTDTNVVDVLCSKSATAPTMPASYTKKRRIASIPRAPATLTTANVMASFTQSNGNRFCLNAPTMDVNDAGLTTTALTYTLATLPTGIRVDALLQWFHAAAAAQSVYLSSLDAQDLAPSDTVTPLGNIRSTANTPASGLSGQMIVRTNLSAQIRARATGVSTMRIAPVCWDDVRNGVN